MIIAHAKPLARSAQATFHVIAGVDEAGRGPLAGPVVAAAVVFGSEGAPEGVDDSKKLSAPRREQLAALIKQRALAFCIVEASAQIIDEINILQATLAAMRASIVGLGELPDEILIDGNRAPDFSAVAADATVKTIIGGDASEVCIGAASILAKTHRDAIMLTMDSRWPHYGFAAHKGYPTKVHLRALEEHGPCEIHRQSYAPVRKSQLAQLRSV